MSLHKPDVTLRVLFKVCQHVIDILVDLHSAKKPR